MGHRASKQRKARPKAKVSPLGDSEIIALEEARKGGSWISDLSFEKLLLKLPSVGRGFKRVQVAFQHRLSTKEASQHHQVLEAQISVPEAKQLLKDLRVSVTEEELHQYFETAGKDDSSPRICFADFLTALAVIVLWKGPEGLKSEGTDKDIVEAIVLAINSFNHFDKDGKGYLRREEVMQTLQEVDKPAHAPSRGGPPPTSPLQQRWQQMDWDDDGCVQLREYLAALHAWSLEDSEED